MYKNILSNVKISTTLNWENDAQAVCPPLSHHLPSILAPYQVYQLTEMFTKKLPWQLKKKSSNETLTYFFRVIWGITEEMLLKPNILSKIFFVLFLSTLALFVCEILCAQVNRIKKQGMFPHVRNVYFLGLFLPLYTAKELEESEDPQYKENIQSAELLLGCNDSRSHSFSNVHHHHVLITVQQQHPLTH